MSERSRELIRYADMDEKQYRIIVLREFEEINKVLDEVNARLKNVEEKNNKVNAVIFGFNGSVSGLLKQVESMNHKLDEYMKKQFDKCVLEVKTISEATQQSIGTATVSIVEDIVKVEKDIEKIEKDVNTLRESYWVQKGKAVAIASIVGVSFSVIAIALGVIFKLMN